MLLNFNMLPNRLELVPSDPSWAELFLAYREDPITKKYNPLEPSTLESLRKRLSIASSHLRSWNESEAFLWFLKFEDQIVGTTSLSKINKQMLTAEIGYGVWASFRGRGLATNAVTLLCAQVFSETPLRKLIAFVHEENIFSIKVLERVGFQREGFLREHYLINGMPANEVVFGLLRSDFDHKR